MSDTSKIAKKRLIVVLKIAEIYLQKAWKDMYDFEEFEMRLLRAVGYCFKNSGLTNKYLLYKAWLVDPGSIE